MKQETFQKQVPVALIALGAHMSNHDLPVPFDIDIDHQRQVLRLRVSQEADQAKWLETLLVEAVEDEPYLGPIWVKSTWAVRLPDIGIAFEISGFRRTTTQAGAPVLSVVSA